MNSIPDDVYDGDDPERNAEILAAMADQLGELEEPDVPEHGGADALGAAYRLGMAAAGRNEYHRGFADALEATFAAMDADQAARISGEWVTALGMRRAPRPLVAQQRGHRTIQVPVRRFATARRVTS